MLRWKSSLKPAAAVVSTDITLEDSAVTTATSFASPTNIDVNIPAVSTDDILILFSTTNDFSEPTDSPPSGWTKIVEKDGDQSGHSTVAAYWKRASSSSVATTETWSAFFPNGEYYYIWVGAYSGCVTSGSPVDAYGTASFGFSSSWSVDVTTTVDNAMVVTISGSTNNSVTQTWADGTELIDTTYASEAAVSINEKLEATSGAKTRSSTASTNTSASMIAVALKPAAATSYLLEERFEESDSGGALGSSTDGYDSTLVSSEVPSSGSTIDPDESTLRVLGGSQSLEVNNVTSSSYVEFDLGTDYDELWFHCSINRGTGSVANRIVLKFFDQAGTASDTLRGDGSNKARVAGVSSADGFTYADNSAVDHFWMHWIKNSTSTFYWGKNTSTRPTSGGNVVSFTAANVSIGKFQIGIFSRNGNYRYDDILISTSEIGDNP